MASDWCVSVCVYGWMFAARLTGWVHERRSVITSLHVIDERPVENIKH